MEPAQAAGRDLIFTCESCGAALVVDSAAAGMTLPCQKCGNRVAVPAASTSPVSSREAELRRQLKENESQRTEITGYINQLQIQLHRWQLRLQTLETRHAELRREIDPLVPSN